MFLFVFVMILHQKRIAPKDTYLSPFDILLSQRYYWVLFSHFFFLKLPG